MRTLLQKILFPAAMVIVSMLVAVAALEGIARLSLPRDDDIRRGLDLQHFSADRAAVPDAVLGYRLKKNVTIANFHFDNLGFVGDDFAPNKPVGVFRIFCLGGSTTLGAGADADRFSYPALLGAIFRKTSRNSDIRVEVINGGVFGYHSWHTLLRTQQELPSYKPDYYVLMDGLNDVMAACLQMPPQELERVSSSMQSVLRQLVAGSGSNWMARLEGQLSDLALYRLAGEIGRKIHALTARDVSPDYARRMALFRFRENLETVLRRAQAAGIGVLLVNHPWIEARLPRVARTMGIPSQHIPLYAFGRQYVSATDKSLARSFGVGLADPQPLFDRIVETSQKPRLVFSDIVHFTRYGNFELAKTVYRALMADPAVKRATGRDGPVSDAALDALFPDILAWKPADGSGWPQKDELALEASVVGMEGVIASPPDADRTVTLAPQADRAVIRLRLTGVVPPRAFFYPRISGDGASTVSVAAIDTAANTRQELFTLGNTTHDGIWSPVSARYDLTLPRTAGLELEITLNGHDAQLWGRDHAWLFQPPAP